MSRYCFYIDGFNVYHALNDIRGGQKRGNFPYRRYKWLNYRKLAESVIGSNDSINGIYYFTAFARWKPSQVIYRHKQYIKALRTVGIETIYGRFMKKYSKCHICNKEFLTHEEKQTDVNIALKLLGDAIEDRYDKALIISADSDLLPAIRAVRKYAPEKEIGVMFPIGRDGYDLKNGTDFRRHMKEKLLEACQFPDEIKVGDNIIKKPVSWQ